MADLRTAAAVTAVVPDPEPVLDDPDAPVPDGDRPGAEHREGGTWGTPAPGLGLPIVIDQDPETESEQPRDWKGEPD